MILRGPPYESPSEREVIFYGIASSFSKDINDFYASREEAERALGQVLADEPAFAGQLWVQAVEFEISPN